MLLARIQIGNTLRLRGTFNDGAVLPASVEFVIQKPDGSKDTLPGELDEDSGTYTAEYEPTDHGTYIVRLVSENPNSADEDVFQVERSKQS